MIIARLVGGLGNQMFQYALGKHLAYIHNTQLKLDTRWFKKGIRDYELKYFHIEENLASENEIASITKQTTNLMHRLQRNVIEPLLPYYKKSVLEEQTNYFDKNVLKSKGDVYLKGYWQSEKYFLKVESDIRKAFAHKDDLDYENKKTCALLKSCNSVSVHIRRGDYISNSDYASRYGSCDIGYYQNAHTITSTKLNNPYYFIFSDDPEWTKKNITFFDPCYFVNHNQGTNSYKDLLLMSLCNHNIIANSSFSWWSAWLNNKADKLIIAPKQWFKDSSAVNKNLIPEKWQRI